MKDSYISLTHIHVTPRQQGLVRQDMHVRNGVAIRILMLAIELRLEYREMCDEWLLHDIEDREFRILHVVGRKLDGHVHDMQYVSEFRVNGLRKSSKCQTQPIHMASSWYVVFSDQQNGMYMYMKMWVWS